MTKDIFHGVYRGKRVLVTGHTGFKGSWLTLWLVQMGAEVAGFSKYLPSSPCFFDVTDLKKKVRHYQGDVCHISQLRRAFCEFRPQVVFHLAAQPIVRRSYVDPKLTFDTNLGGTVNVLECVRASSFVRAAVMITSDKCYENLSLDRGYHENDRLGGADPYSASKACAEIACSAFYRSFFAGQDRPGIAMARAGNVIGGGDWAKDRIVPDCMRAWSRGKPAIIRNPHATRPWQHVLEPLSGYLWLGACLMAGQRKTYGEAFNFGPYQRATKNVGQLADLCVSFWEKASWEHVPSGQEGREALLLQLSPRKTADALSWRAVLSFKETARFTALWYKAYYDKRTNMLDLSCQQIRDYISKAQARGLVWTKGRAT